VPAFLAIVLLAGGGVRAQEVESDTAPRTGEQTATDTRTAPEEATVPSTPSVPGSWRPVNPFPEDEAPPYLLDLDVGDSEVELFLLGSWIASSRVSTGIAFHPPLPESGDRVTLGYPYPGFETRLFSQTVDLTVSLWLYRRYFFEATFADDSDVNSIAAGYYAADDELVREFVIGNVPLAVSRYPYQYSGSTGARAGRKPNPGTVLRLQTDRTYHEFLLQLENTSQRRIRLAGGAIVEEARLRPEEYLQGRAFVLPDGAVTAVELFVQDENGTVLATPPGGGALRRFRILDAEAGEYVVDATAGTVRLADTVPPDRTVAIYYETSAGPVGTAGNGSAALVPLDDADGSLAPTTGALKPFSFSEPTLFDFSTETEADYDGAGFRLDLSDGRDALILRAPGLWSPFEGANLYALPEGVGSDARYRIVRRYTRTAAENDLQLRRLPGTDILQVIRPGSDTRSLGYRYPWAEEPPRETSARIYGPRTDRSADLTETEILVEYSTPADRLVLDGDLVPGSVAITTGGRGVPGATVDYDTGTVELPPGAADSATVDVTYRVYEDGAGTSDLVFINGNRWTPRPDLDVTLATGLRWTLTDNGYSTELNQHPGQVTVSSGVEWTSPSEELRLGAAGAAQVSQSDTTGYMRLFGSAPEDTVLAPGEDSLFPARAAAGLATRTGDYSEEAGGGTDPDLTEANRVYPVYRDYWSADALGNVSLASYPTLPSADPSTAGSRIGPYLARSTDAEYSGTVGVLEWDALPEGTWTGARIARIGEESDLRDAQSVSITYRYIADGTGGVAPKLLLEIGALGEDLDGDGTLDRGRSAVDPTLEFNGGGGVRRAGQDAPTVGRPHSEDVNRNGVIDDETPSGVFSYLLSAGADAGAGWRTVEISHDDFTALDRSRLGAVRAVRLVAAAAGGAVPAGRIIIGEVRFRRTRNVTVVETGTDSSGSVAVVPDPLEEGSSLRSRESIVEDRFVPDEDEQRVVRVGWDAGADSVSVEFPIPEFTPRAYGTVRGYFYLDPETPVTAGGNGKITLGLSPYRGAPSSETISATIPAGELTGGWHEAAITLETEELSIDGSRSAGPVTVGNDVDRELLRIGTVTVSGIEAGGIDAGSLYFDEIHAADARTGFAVAGRLEADWSRTFATGIFAGAELYVSQSVEAQSEDFQASGTAATEQELSAPGETIAPGRGAVASSSRGGIRSGHLHLEGEVLTRESTEGNESAFGHLVQLPLAPQGIVVARESFFRDYRMTDPSFRRGLGVTINGGVAGRYRADTTHRIAPFDADQSWRFDASLPSPRWASLTVQTDASLYAPRLEVETDTYGADWVRSNGYLAPISTAVSPQERRHDSRGSLNLWNLELGGEVGWDNRSSLSGEQESRIGLTSALPLEFAPAGRRPWKVTPSYRRSYSFTEEEESTTFDDDGAIWQNRIGTEPLVFTAPFVVELFQPAGPGPVDAFDPDELGRSYESEGRLRFGRAFSSRVSDLWTPADVEALVRRSLSWEGNSTADTRLWQMSITAVAINLFGTDGSTPLAGFYRSDEFRNAVILALQETPRSDTEPRWSIGFEQESSFFGAGDNRFDILTSLDIAGGGGGSGGGASSATVGSEATYVWDRPGYPDLAVFERMEEKPFYRHEERLALEVTTGEGEFTGSTVTVGHVTRLMIADQGSISVFGDLGWIADPGEYEDGALHLIGLQFGIEGRLSY